MTNPIIRNFKIFGLHGYKDVEIDFPGPARIIIAENGTGKTTILAALYAFLKKDFYRLMKIKFERIECVLADSALPLKVLWTDVQTFEVSPELEKLGKYGAAGPGQIREAIRQLDSSSDFADDVLLNDIYMRSPLDADEFQEIIVKIQQSMPAMPKSLAEVTSSLDAALGSIELLYLPTYRRVELPSIPTLRRARNSRNRPADTVKYGLRDVQDRLTEILNDIQRYSNSQYRAISASIIDDALGGKINPASIRDTKLPDIDALRLFFSRVEGEQSTTDRLASLRSLYESGEIAHQDQLVLRYFLSKLNAVVERTKRLESNVQTFVEKVNVYLNLSSDEKTLTYDSDRMKVIVNDNFTGGEIDLEALSSGEKQVISLLSHLYLDPGEKILLIDEPELSLSIDWQKRLLPDLMSAPSCAQLLAITHSPFIFDNELDPYAGPLIIRRRALGARA